MQTHTNLSTPPRPSANVDGSPSTASDSHWKQRPESFAAFYRKPFSLSPAAIVARFLDARTDALEALMDCRAKDKILDIGCGSGVHMLRFLDRAAHVTGVDYSQAMLTLARNALERTARTNWELHCADAAHLPFEDGSFDTVIGMGLLDYVPSPADVLTEIARVLKHGGEAILTIPKSPSIFSLLRTRFGNFIKRSLFRLPPVGNVQTRASLEKLMEETGFETRELRPIWTAMWMVKAVRV